MAITTRSLPGADSFSNLHLNRSTGFTPAERAALRFQGLLPAAVLSLEEQAKRSYEQYWAQPSDLAKTTLSGRCMTATTTSGSPARRDHSDSPFIAAFTAVIVSSGLALARPHRAAASRPKVEPVGMREPA